VLRILVDLVEVWYSFYAKLEMNVLIAVME
jgi:hypothetical protein